METQLLTTNRKALTINLNGEQYGTLAEIGAGQEVARHFFQAGGASGTIAKTISAYDMKFSDEIYGKSSRYVSRERLEQMLEHEYSLIKERLWDARAQTSKFFAFADTVATRSFKGSNEAHGWMGIRFQLHPLAEPNDIVIHVRMWDKEAVHQQEALGVVGVNLIFGAYHYHGDLERFVTSLADNVGTDRIEVDMIYFSGPDFPGVDNRFLSLLLVRHGLTNAVMFGPSGRVLQPSEVLHKKPVLVERGSFRPVTQLNLDMLNCACARFVQEPEVQNREIVVLMEITMMNLLTEGAIDPRDFLSRVDMLAALGHTVLISNYPEFFRLTTYFRRYTREMIGVALGISNLLEIFNEKYYENLPGGILESFGRLFKNAVKLYVYPMRQDVFRRYLGETQPETAAAPQSGDEFTSGVLITARNLVVTPRLQNLYAHLFENRYLEPLAGFDPDHLTISSKDVLRLIREGDPRWEPMVPAQVASMIKERGLFQGTTTGG